MNKTFALVDCNNFFVSCERVFRPDLEGKPVVVLSNNDGVIIARSNEVKKLGVPMAAPLFKWENILKEHNTTVFSANFTLYGDLSRRVVAVLKQFSPDIEVYSVDEAFVDLSLLARTDYDKLAKEIHDKVKKWTGLPVSVGVGPSKTIAKAAADYAKKHPEANGSYGVRADQDGFSISWHEVMDWLPVEDVWGIGFRWAPRLINMGVKTASAFTQLSEKWVKDNMTVTGQRTWKELRGESMIPLNESLYIDEHQQKSLSVTRLFGHTIRSQHEIEASIASYVSRGAAKLRRRKQLTWDVTVYVQRRVEGKFFQSFSKKVKLPFPTADTGVIIHYAIKGFRQIFDSDYGYRRAGIIMTELVPRSDQQLAMIDGKSVNDLRKSDNLMEALDSINKRYGGKTVTYGIQGPQKKQRWYSKSDRLTPAYTTKWEHLPVVKA